ncbi:hypothetical protein BU15DRAFT_75834 [Melanogaster broomeanus]|nr:hypothetical protein BU15DRAFT_75834 [Melanogaster broomeanus]
MSTFTPVPLSLAQSRGLIVVAVFALLSALALAFIASRVIRLVAIPFIRGDNSTRRAPENLFFRTQLGHYAASLVLSNAFITAAGLIEFSWVTRSLMGHGSLCSAQATLMQIGIWSTCYFMVALGVHTCNSLVFRIRQVTWLSSVVVAIGWAIAFVAALAPMQKHNIYVPIGISCGIAPVYPTEVFILEAFPIILGAVLSVVVYSLIFLVLHGRVSIKDGLQFSIKAPTTMERALRFRRVPQVYRCHCSNYVLVSFSFHGLLTAIVPHPSVDIHRAPGLLCLDVFAHICCFMLGFVNVGLLYNTFRVISPVFHGPPGVKPVMETESFGNNAFDESPVLPRPTYMPKGLAIPLYQANGQPRDSVQLTHSRSSSDSSADSSTELLSIKRKSSKYNGMRVRQADLTSSMMSKNIVPPAELSRQLDTESATSRQSSIKGHKLRISLPPVSPSEALSPPLLTVSLTPAPRLPTPVGAEHDPVIKGSKRLSRQTTEAFGRLAKQPSFKLKVPAALTLAPIPASPSSLSMREVTNKSATLAARLGLPVAPESPALYSASIRPLPSADIPVVKLDKGKGKAIMPLPPIPQISVTSSSPLGSWASDIFLSSLTASQRDSSAPPSVDSDSEYSPEPLHPSVGTDIRALPKIPEPDDEEADITDPESPSPPPLKYTNIPETRRTTMASVWSQDSADIAYRISISTMPGRQAAPAGPRVAPEKMFRPVKVASRISFRLGQALKTSKSAKGFDMVLAPNDSAV